MKGIALTIFILLTFGEGFSSSDFNNTLRIRKLLHVSNSSLTDRGRQTKDLGVVKLKESYQDKLGILKLYNKNGSIWLSFKFTDNFKSPLLDPLSLKTDDGILVFNCIGEHNAFYAVIVSRDHYLVKYIKKSDANFLFETWQQRILSVFAVEFDDKTNPLRENPSTVSQRLNYNDNDFYHPMKIKGNWLKVKSNDTNRTGWIKWCNDKGKMLIELNDAD